MCISGSYILAIYNIHILHNDYIILIMKAGEDTGETHRQTDTRDQDTSRHSGETDIYTEFINK